MNRPMRPVRRIRPDVIAVTLLAVLLIIAAGAGVASCAPPATPNHPSPITSGRVEPFRNVYVAGVAHPVPATLPADCRHAYVVIGGPLIVVRDAAKRLLTSGGRDDVDRIDGAAAKLREDSAAVDAATLDCQSQSVPVARAYRDGVAAALTLDLVFGIANTGPYSPIARSGIERDLAAVETALAQQ